jgi:hypothetical protein
MNIGNLLKTDMRNILSVTPFKNSSKFGKFGNKLAKKATEKIAQKANDAIQKKLQKVQGIIGDIDKKLAGATFGILGTGNRSLSSVISNSKIGGMLQDLKLLTMNDDNNRNMNGDVMYRAKYQVPTLIMMMGSEQISFNVSNIQSIEYMNNYDFNIMPVIKLTLRLDIRQRMWILRNKKNIQVKFQLDRVGVDMENERIVSNPASLWNQVFNLYLSDSDDSVDTDGLESRLDENDGSSMGAEGIGNAQKFEENYYESQHIVDVYLLDKQLMDASRYSFNAVYSEATIQQMVAHMLTQSGHKKVLMSKMQNDEIYKEVLLPVNPVFRNLLFLDQYYGMYESGAVIYYDNDTLYILDSGNVSNAKSSGEITDITIMVKGDTESIPGHAMVMKSSNDSYYISTRASDVKFGNSNDTAMAGMGATSQIIVQDTSDIEKQPDTTTSAANGEKDGDTGALTTFIKDNHKYIASIIETRKGEKASSVHLTLSDVDIGIFKPNHVVQFVFTDEKMQTKYAGDQYRIVYAYHYIKLSGDIYMDAGTHVILRKLSPVTTSSNTTTSQEKPKNWKEDQTTFGSIGNVVDIFSGKGGCFGNGGPNSITSKIVSETLERINKNGKHSNVAGVLGKVAESVMSGKDPLSSLKNVGMEYLKSGLKTYVVNYQKRGENKKKAQEMQEQEKQQMNNLLKENIDDKISEYKKRATEKKP